LEFRHSAAEADPFDVALSTSIPIVSATLKSVKVDITGKALIGGDELPTFVLGNVKRSSSSLAPKSHEEAAQLFNVVDNLNFVFLDELAARKIVAENLQGEEAEKWRGIGTRLHGMYCRQYGMQSAMEVAQAKGAGFAAAAVRRSSGITFP
jgi:hypothetical protein